MFGKAAATTLRNEQPLLEHAVDVVLERVVDVRFSEFLKYLIVLLLVMALFVAVAR